MSRNYSQSKPFRNLGIIWNFSEPFRNSRNHFGNVRNHFEIFRNHFERNLVSKSFRKSLGPNFWLLFWCILATLSMYCLFQFFAREVSNHGCFSVLPVYCFHVFIKRFFQRRRAAHVRLVSHHVATGSWARDGQLAAKPRPVRIFCKPHSCSNEARLQRVAVPTTRRNLLWGANSTPENAQRQPESGVRTDVSVASDEGLLVPARSSIYWWAGQATFRHYTRATGMPKSRVQQLDTNCFGSWSEPANNLQQAPRTRFLFDLRKIYGGERCKSWRSDCRRDVSLNNFVCNQIYT